MYKATIKTKYNVITLNINDTNDEQFKEVCEQPYIEEVRIEKTKEELIKERDELLNHCVGMSYNMQKVLEINKEIECREKKLKLVKESNLKGSEE